MEKTEKDWKLKLRYGKLNTPFQHFTIIAPVLIRETIKELSAKPGTAYAGIKSWATDSDEAAEIIYRLALQMGFTITGNMEIFETNPNQPPGQEAFAYDVNFSYYDE